MATEVRVTQLDTVNAAFIGTPSMAAKFARMNFKLGEQWFDVEGVVVARWTGSGACACELRFSAMSGKELERLKLALRPPERDIVPRRDRPRLSRTRPTARLVAESVEPLVRESKDPLPTYSKRDVKEVILEAMKSLAV